MIEQNVNIESGKITIVPQDLFAQIWPQVVPMFKDSEDVWQEFYSLQDLQDHILNGDLQLWVAIENKKIFAVGLTALEKYPRCLILRCLFLAGTGVKKILPCVKEIEEWAETLGASKSEIIGRDAWEVLTPPYGYVKRGVLMMKNLNVGVSNDRRH